MKTLRMYLVITLLVWTTSLVVLLRQAYTADVNKDNLADIKQDGNAIHKIQAGIDADRDKIIEENKAIVVDRRKLKEAEKIADKAKIEQINQNIEKRKAVIKDLKKDIRNKKDQKSYLIYGKPQNMPKRSRKE